MLSHFGKPFDEADVRSVCDIAESTKNESSIGRFGLGFKSVYTVTELPEIHSGDEDFAIENYVFPKRLARSARAAEETQIILPLRPEDASAARDITIGFRHLGPGALLFLRNIEEINWDAEGAASGFYLRNRPEVLGDKVHRIAVIGQETGKAEIDQNWLVFHRNVFSSDNLKVGRVEIAFLLAAVKDSPGRWVVRPLAKAPLVVFFPTVVESHLGFLVQGPYRTTPGRDNIPPRDSWNQHLVKETSVLLVEAMRWLRDEAMLDAAALRCMPLDREKFLKDSRFEPMFDAVRQAFLDEDFLPSFGAGHVTARQAKLARTQELRELLSPEQVAKLFGSDVSSWLSDEFTEVRTPEIRRYLMRELDIDEITPTKLVPSLSKSFLEAQCDEWVLRLYEFLNGQEKALRPHLDTIPIIRLDDGTHVAARIEGKAKAFLPSAIITSLPTMRRAVCGTPEARLFLISLGITEPDPVDDVILNLLPKYQKKKVDVSAEAYVADIERIRAAFNTDSSGQKEKLWSALRNTTFVMVIEIGDGNAYLAKPMDSYIATDRLQQLFTGVPNILIVDNEYDCLRGEDIRDLLVSCGASRYLIPQLTPSNLRHPEKASIRKEAGLERASWENQPEDFTLRGLTQLLEFLPTLKQEEAAARAKALWEALADLEARGTSPFYGSYKWGYSHEVKTARFDAAFVRTLNQVAWVPNADRELVPPRLLVFDTLGWKSSPFLQSKIAFKPPIIDQLAKEAGIDPAALDLLRKLGITNLAALTSRLGIINPPVAPELPPALEPETNELSDGNVYERAKDLYGDDMSNILAGTPDPDGGDGVGLGAGSSSQTPTAAGTSSGGGDGNGGDYGGSRAQSISGDKGGWQRKGTPSSVKGRPFDSYVGTHPDDDVPDPDGLDQAERMQIEASAIDLIMSAEPALHRTPEGNPGFDLFQTDDDGRQVRWIEVKSMTGTLEDRPVGLSHTQFDYARHKGDAYWLYVVERATEPMKARVLKIQNPVGHARTFTFDRGWSQIALSEHLFSSPQ